MKKIVSILLIFSVIIALCLNVSAASVYDVGSFTKTSYLSITNGQATCKSSYSESNGNTASVKITQSLEKHSFLWFWDTVGGEWTTNSKKSSVSFTNYKSGLASGTYRVKSVFTVTTTSGQTETVTVYSAEKTISCEGTLIKTKSDSIRLLRKAHFERKGNLL